MPWRLALLLGLALLFGCAGCRNCDLVEAELRTLEKDLNELKGELFRSESHNEALQREVQNLRQGPVKATPEEASQQFSVRQIVLGRGTGGYDNDDCPGDEALQVVLEPRDGDGHAVKASGSLYVEVVEINREGLKTLLSSWDVPPEQLRRTWRSGFLSSGYHVVLPWKAWPNSEKLRVVARFALADGRTFEADKDVTVRPTPLPQRKPAPSDGIDLGPQLPPPRKAEPETTSSSQKPWWAAPATPASAEVPGVWQPKKQPPLNEAIELLRPIPLADPPVMRWQP